MRTRTKTKAKRTLKTKTTTQSNSEFALAHKRLEAILRKYRRGLQSRPDPTGGFCLVGPPTETSRGREVWFGAVQTRKNYVSYHLMPVYVFPELLKGASPELKKRMQGKSCFNFRGVDAKLFAELAKLTERGYQRFKEEKLIR